MGPEGQEGIYRAGAIDAEPKGKTRGDRLAGSEGQNRDTPPATIANGEQVKLIPKPAQETGDAHSSTRETTRPSAVRKTPDVIYLPYVDVNINRERDKLLRWGRHNQRLNVPEAYDEHPDFGSVHFNADLKIITEIVTRNGIDDRGNKEQRDIRQKLLPAIGLPIRNFIAREQKIRKRFFESGPLQPYHGSLQMEPVEDTVLIVGHRKDETIFVTDPQEIASKDKTEIHGSRRNGEPITAASPLGENNSIHTGGREEHRVYVGGKGEARKLTLEAVIKRRLYDTYGISQNPDAQRIFDETFGPDISFMVTNQRRVLKELHQLDPVIKKFRRIKAMEERRKKARSGVVFEAKGGEEEGKEGQKFKSSATLRQEREEQRHAA